MKKNENIFYGISLNLTKKKEGNDFFKLAEENVKIFHFTKERDRQRNLGCVVYRLHAFI